MNDIVRGLIRASPSKFECEYDTDDRGNIDSYTITWQSPRGMVSLIVSIGGTITRVVSPSSKGVRPVQVKVSELDRVLD